MTFFNIDATSPTPLFKGGGRGLLAHTWIMTEIKYIIQRYTLSDDDMIYTYVNMYIAFVTPVMDVRDRDQV